jgi:hypothetical protein
LVVALRQQLNTLLLLVGVVVVKIMVAVAVLVVFVQRLAFQLVLAQQSQ